MIRHLDLHGVAGDAVPDAAYAELRAQIRDLGDIAFAQHHTDPCPAKINELNTCLSSGDDIDY